MNASGKWRLSGQVYMASWATSGLPISTTKLPTVPKVFRGCLVVDPAYPLMGFKMIRHQLDPKSWYLVFKFLPSSPYRLVFVRNIIFHKTFGTRNRSFCLESSNLKILLVVFHKQL